MQKSAQSKRELGRGIGSWLKDIPSAVSGKAAEKFFDPEFKKVMTSLRKVDNNIRSIITGESIGTESDPDEGEVSGDPGRYKISMKALLKKIKSDLNRREYMSAAADLGRFQAKLFEIVNQIHGLDNRVNELHHQFLFGTKDKPILTEEQWEHLQDVKKRYARKQRELLIKEAGFKDIADFFHNITNERGKGLAALEKRYPKKTEKLKKDSKILLAEGESILTTIIAALKEMASLRATRNPDKYMDVANKLAKRTEVFDAKYKDYYQNNVKSLLEKAEPIYSSKKVEETKAKEMGKQDIPVEGPAPAGSPAGTAPAGKGETEIDIPVTWDDPVSERGPTVLAPGNVEIPRPAATPRQQTLPYGESVLSPGAPPHAPPRHTMMYGDQIVPSPGSAPGAVSKTDPSMLAPPNEFNKSEQIEKEILSKNPGMAAKLPTAGVHQEFFKSLDKLSTAHPSLLKSFINKYARSIQGSDPITAINLFKIAKNIEE